MRDGGDDDDDALELETYLPTKSARISVYEVSNQTYFYHYFFCAELMTFALEGWGLGVVLGSAMVGASPTHIP